jgi:hypothetical protein
MFTVSTSFFMNIHVLRRFIFASFSLSFLGMGSSLFHATQTQWAEALDEIGMVLTLTSLCFLLYNVHPATTGTSGYILCAIFVLIQCVSGAIYVSNSYHPYFAASYMASALLLLPILTTMPSGVAGEATGPSGFKGSGLPVVKLHRLGIASSIVGYMVWHVDQHCVREGWQAPTEYAYEHHWVYWTHPLWHVLTAAGVYLLYRSVMNAYVIAMESRTENPPGKHHQNLKETAIGVPVHAK